MQRLENLRSSSFKPHGSSSSRSKTKFNSALPKQQKQKAKTQKTKSKQTDTMAPPSSKRWGDDVDDDDDSLGETQTPLSKTTIPKPHTAIDAKGNKTITSYRPNPSNSNQLYKTTTKIRVNKIMVREHVDVEKRRQWRKFGQADNEEDQSNVTIQSRDDIYLADPNADTDLQEEDVGKALAGNLNEFWAKQQRRQLQRKYDVGGPEEEAKADGWQTVGGAADKGAAGKYVPPSARGGAAGKGKGTLADMANRMGDKPVQDNRDQNTIRVTNISEDTTEADLQELFSPFGRISRVYLAKDKETMQSRGFAFVSFVHREDAAKAMEKLQGYGYDHLILKLEWARPSAPKDPGSEGTQFRSGYGKALAQDTKDKVSYASNLTR
jgi:translation initiation factor 3 subunit G